MKKMPYCLANRSSKVLMYLFFDESFLFFRGVLSTYLNIFLFFKPVQVWHIHGHSEIARKKTQNCKFFAPSPKKWQYPACRDHIKSTSFRVICESWSL